MGSVNDKEDNNTDIKDINNDLKPETNPIAQPNIKLSPRIKSSISKSPERNKLKPVNRNDSLQKSISNKNIFRSLSRSNKHGINSLKMISSIIQNKKTPESTSKINNSKQTTNEKQVETIKIDSKKLIPKTSKRKLFNPDQIGSFDSNENIKRPRSSSKEKKYEKLEAFSSSLQPGNFLSEYMSEHKGIDLSQLGKSVVGKGSQRDSKVKTRKKKTSTVMKGKYDKSIGFKLKKK